MDPNMKLIPEYKLIEMDLKARGKLSDWIYETVDPSRQYASFIEINPNYRSNCPFYNGYWLYGGCSSVECYAFNGPLIPGIQWNIFCRENHENCPFYKERHGV